MHDVSGAPRDGLRRSLLLLGVVIAIALAGLAIDGNWPKVLRVAAAAGTYAAALLVLARPGTDVSRRWWWFAVAGVCAGVASGLFRPEPGAASIAVDSGAAIVLATMHWMGLGLSEKVRQKITA